MNVMSKEKSADYFYNLFTKENLLTVRSGLAIFKAGSKVNLESVPYLRSKLLGVFLIKPETINTEPLFCFNVIYV